MSFQNIDLPLRRCGSIDIYYEINPQPEIWSLYHFMKCGIALNVKMKIVSGITHMEVRKTEDSMIILIIMSKKKSLLKDL